MLSLVSTLLPIASFAARMLLSSSNGACINSVPRCIASGSVVWQTVFACAFTNTISSSSPPAVQPLVAQRISEGDHRRTAAPSACPSCGPLNTPSSPRTMEADQSFVEQTPSSLCLQGEEWILIRYIAVVACCSSFGSSQVVCTNGDDLITA
ncbi:hypothetical protein PWT90_10896 [Aphanocladium album]|nr:hypothetical protein PWT90_10896 [Aphanocladium album]